jgi:hypothetical protein
MKVPARRRRRRDVFGVPRWMVGALIGALVVGLAIAVLVTAGGDDSDVVLESEGGGECTADTRMDTYSTEGGGVVHTDHPSYAGPLGNPPTYAVDPPSGGDHLSASVGHGTYDGDNVPPDGVLVHSLEHGYVILWYRSDTPNEDVGDIEAAQKRYRRDVIVVERPKLSVPVAATAWGHRLLCQRADPAELAEFVRTRRNQAPEKIRH